MTALSRGHPALWLAAFVTLLLTLTGTPAFTQNVTREVWLVPIETEIGPATTQYLRSRIERANEEQPLALVFYVDTPGGQILAAEDIVNLILQETNVPTIAVVANAISAGAIIAMSAEQVAMLPGSSIGAATAINGITGEQASEKINSVWRNFFRSVAEARGRNPEVAEGMVSERIEVPGLSTDEELITLSAPQAVEFNIADIQARTVNDALEQLGYGGAEVTRLEPRLAERIGFSLGNPIIAAALLVIGIGGILIEVFTPGFGLPGVVGALALVALGTGLFIATPPGVVDIVLIMAGILLLLLEAFVVPGFGVAGVLGFAALLIPVVRFFDSPRQQIMVVSYTAIFASLLMVAFFWLLPNSRFTKIFALSTRLSNEPGTDPERGRLVASHDYLKGLQGMAATDLRPAGVAKIGSERVDVVTEGDFISVGSTIEVLRVEGSRVVVRAVEA